MDATKTEPQINLKICSAGVFLVASCVVKGHEQPDYNCVHKCRKELKWQFKNVHTSAKKKKKITRLLATAAGKMPNVFTSAIHSRVPIRATMHERTE